MIRIASLAVILAVALAAQTAITITVPARAPSQKQLVETIPVSADPAVTTAAHLLPKTPMKDTLLLVFYGDRFVGAFPPAGPNTRALEISLPTSRPVGDVIRVIYWTLD